MLTPEQLKLKAALDVYVNAVIEERAARMSDHPSTPYNKDMSEAAFEQFLMMMDKFYTRRPIFGRKPTSGKI